MEEKQIFIVPDVHGRKFWEGVKTFADSGYRIIFLGDYLDPYPHEHITPEESMMNFEEILDFAEKHSNVTLLLGNHDMEYFSRSICDCRCIDEYYDEIRDMFISHLDMFNLATTDEVNGKKFVFSHAGITPGWADMYYDFGDDIYPVIEDINKKLHSDWHKLKGCLSDVSYYRWGCSQYGSVVWADVREHIKRQYTDVVQIFGHTQLEMYPCAISDNAFDLDFRQLFFIDKEGTVKYLSTGEGVLDVQKRLTNQEEKQ